jgi:hypothetical protein
MQYRSKGSKGSKQQKHHDIAERDHAAARPVPVKSSQLGNAVKPRWRERRVKGFSKVERACGVTKTPTAKHSGLRIAGGAYSRV